MLKSARQPTISNMHKHKYNIQKTANVISILFEDYPVKTWYVNDFTERKLNNAIRKLEKQALEHGAIAVFERNF